VTEATEFLEEHVLLKILLQAQTIEAVIVGGQALNIWGERHWPRAGRELAAFAPFQSKDIDFLGDHHAAEALARSLGGRAARPSGDHFATPSSAAVHVVIDGRPYTIDFLHSLAGLETRAVVARAVELTVEGPHGPIDAMVLHPMDVLRARIAAVTVLRRRDRGARRQLGAAPVIARKPITELIETSDAQDLDEAQDLVREMIDLVASPAQDVDMAEHGVDLLDHAGRLADRPEWHSSFADHQIRRPVERARRRRARRMREAERRRRRRPTAGDDPAG
jgi:hypothetical protein